MADEKLMTDAEIESALRDAERLLKMLSAFAAVRDLASRYSFMKQGIRMAERQRLEAEASTAKAKDDLKKADIEYKAKLIKLETAAKKKQDEMDISLNKSHSERVAELGRGIASLEGQRLKAEDAVAEVREELAKLGKQREAIAAANKNAEDSIAKLDETITAKRGELDHVKASFDVFVAAHNLR